MTREEIAAWIDRRLHALNGHDADALARLYADDCAIESPTVGRGAHGAKAAADIDRAWIGGFPDVTFTTAAQLIDGDRAAWVGTASGTDRGGFMGVAPTDKRFSIPMVLFTVIRDGRISRERRVYDFTGMLMQIGVLKARPNAAVPEAASSASPRAAEGVAPGVDVADLVRTHAAAFVRHDADAVASLHTDDAAMDSNLAGRVSGRAAVADVYRQWFTALPDSGFEIEDLIVDGSRAVAMVTMTGTDTGGFFGLPPTGRPVHVRSAWVYSIRGRQLSYVQPVYDFTGMLAQMGVIRPKPA